MNAFWMRIVLIIGLTAASSLHAAEEAPDFAKEVLPILTAKCGGCHGDLETEGKLSLATYDDLMKGGEHGPAVTPGESGSSRLYLMSAGTMDPKMPPEDEEPLSEGELATLEKWIGAGAKGPSGETVRPMPTFPQVDPAEGAEAITAIAWSPDGKTLAVGSFGAVELLSVDALGGRPALQRFHRFSELSGKINRLSFASGGSMLVAASGVAGAEGEASIMEAPHVLELKGGAPKLRDFAGHSDALYDAVLSPDGTILATAGYDRQILLRDAKTGETLRTLDGHNGAVFDLAFSPDGTCLVSASADETAKVWNVATGERLDTLNQCEAEQWTCAFDPTLDRIYSAGADHRIRCWNWVSKTQPKINPILYSRFAHEGTVTHIALAIGKPLLASVADDGTLKVWRTKDLSLAWVGPTQPATPTGIAFSPEGDRLAVSRIDGTLDLIALPGLDAEASGEDAANEPLASLPALIDAALPEATDEVEPNDDVQSSEERPLPIRMKGLLAQPGDADCVRFAASAGERWIIETNAARSGSPADTLVEVLAADGSPVLRTRLQAVRDSYFTFRGKDSNVSDDFRIHNWQEMELNDLLYANGEVVRLWLYPRGPDSGFKVYPGFGNRRTYFDTPALSHALGEPCWIVREVPPGVEPLPNGLPVFDVYYENDDDGDRKLGKDSKLLFAPAESGEYVVRVRDVRGEGSDAHTYELTVRPAKPGFSVKASVTKGDAVPAGGGREIEFAADRIDGFEGPIELAVEGLPAGWSLTTPAIEAGQLKAWGAIYAAADAKAPTEEEWKQVRLVSRAQIDREQVERDVAGLPLPKLAGAPAIGISISRVGGEEQAPAEDAAQAPLEVTLRPGETIELRVDVDRKDVKSRISFGNEDSGRNLPHGVFVDNVGLNGLLIVEDKSERTFFIRAAAIAEPQTRLFHLRADTDGGLVSQPVVLRIVP
ncbi:MAG TPA: c-type cytochrome domain-containing protein [Pirellulaceae bacterium]|jgi:hypothetical protein|nr:c-type cytochrome domain-containing protein [Pirellulaceae bacterium]